jgi:glycosyltransferase involved in cell wall biosynthesis
MAVYNASAYVREAIASICAQTFRGFDFILIDDGSTDSSLAILREFAARDPRIRLVSRPNVGLAKTLNEGLELAGGRFIARMDADDVAMPDRFQKQLDYLREHPECVCVGSRVRLIDPCGSPLRETDHKLTHDEINDELLAGIGWAIVHPAATMRRDAVVAVGGYREQYNCVEDLDLFLRLSEIGKVANLPDVLLEYRQHFQSVNYTRHEQQRRLKESVVREAYQRRGLPMPRKWEPAGRSMHTHAGQLQAWAWSALKRGNVQVARRHAFASLRLGPFSRDAWRTMYCAIRGR